MLRALCTPSFAYPFHLRLLRYYYTSSLSIFLSAHPAPSPQHHPALCSLDPSAFTSYIPLYQPSFHGPRGPPPPSHFLDTRLLSPFDRYRFGYFDSRDVLLDNAKVADKAKVVDDAMAVDDR